MLMLSVLQQGVTIQPMQPSSGQQPLRGQGVVGRPAQQPVIPQQQQAPPITKQQEKGEKELVVFFVERKNEELLL